MAPSVPSRRLRGLAVAACAAIALPIAAAAPVGAQTTTTTTTTTADTAAAALRVTVNLPQGNTLQIELDPALGTIRSVTGQGPGAEAYAAILRGSLGDESEAFGEAYATLPAPTEADGSPFADLNDGINDSELGTFLTVEALESRASVTPAPSSASNAGTRIDLGLPPQLVEGLAEPLEQILAGLELLIDELAGGLEGPVDQFCAGLGEGIGQLEPVTTPVGEGLSQIPGLGGIVAGATTGDLPLLCEVADHVQTIGASLVDSLEEISLFTIGTLEASQTITTEGTRVTARATAEAADITLLGEQPFGEVGALSTTSTAVLDTGFAEATVEQEAVELEAADFAFVQTDLETVTGELGDVELDGVTELVAVIDAILTELSGVGVSGGSLGSADDTLDACPGELMRDASGTFEQPGVCAAAIALGYGLFVELPEELAGEEALDLAGPLVAVQLVPSDAVVRRTVATATTPAPPTQQQAQLPRTGAAAPLAVGGLVLLVGAALLRRRRAHVEG
jgi:LPXTG-motif cell wall-anchored protein